MRNTRYSQFLKQRFTAYNTIYLSCRPDPTKNQSSIRNLKYFDWIVKLIHAYRVSYGNKMYILSSDVIGKRLEAICYNKRIYAWDYRLWLYLKIIRNFLDSPKGIRRTSPYIHRISLILPSLITFPILGDFDRIVMFIQTEWLTKTNWSHSRKMFVEMSFYNLEHEISLL